MMKKENLTNKIMNRFFYLSLIGWLGLAVVVTFTHQTNAQKKDLKKILAGEVGLTWQLKQIKTETEDLKEEDFDSNKVFALKSQLAQMVPETIIFNADGTCENTYVSRYENGEISDENYTAPCKWSVEENTVEIIENANDDNKIEESRDEVFWLKDIQVTEDHFISGFSLQGNYTGGVEVLSYEVQK